jgi:hypothetical protein
MEPKEIAIRLLRCLPEFTIALLVLVSLGVHLGNDAPMSAESIGLCQSTVTVSCVRNASIWVNGTIIVNENACLCVSDRSFFYGSIAAGAILYHISRTLFNTVAATKLIFIIAAVFGVVGYTFCFVGVALSLTESLSLPAALAVGALFGVACLVSLADTIYEFFKRRQEE